MLRMKRKRWPLRDLIARYRCATCGNVVTFSVALRPYSERDPYPGLYGRPTKVICRDASHGEMSYEGFVSATRV